MAVFPDMKCVFVVLNSTNYFKICWESDSLKILETKPYKTAKCKQNKKLNPWSNIGFVSLEFTNYQKVKNNFSVWVPQFGKLMKFKKSWIVCNPLWGLSDVLSADAGLLLN